MRTVLAWASLAIAWAVASVGGSTGGRGRGSKPTNTSGSPDPSSRLPSSAAISTGGGRAALRVRIAVDVWAASVSLGIGPIASRPPASHTISSAWAAPVTPPATRSAAPSMPVPNARAIIRPIADPIDSPMPDRGKQAAKHDEWPDRGREAPERIDQVRQREDREHAAADRAEQAADLGQGPRPEPEHDGEHHQDDGDEVERIHSGDGPTGRAGRQSNARGGPRALVVA